ncbi:hypothetical protein PFISCL1PPCAC_10141 [Pristionchus fissidentatus]|uniref:Helicase n=1 Tax=Pristionchus fissidentatus TaxID=1538716 RepID=A0AAV5VH84_9BILA|nr:hypothetical protein PFISCL1PPCAC_10141 [Pristionchus fissidentatus]
MSGNWDDTDSEDDNVEIVDKPVIIARSRQPSIAKSLEKAGVEILENPIEGSENNQDDSDDSMSVGSYESEDFETHEGEVIVLDFDATANMKKMIAQFYVEQRNIISEFADTEIFVISLDSLIIECLEHKYHDWTLAGQSIVLAAQIDRFLNQFTLMGGRFKLVVFTDLWTHFSRDTTLSFVRCSAIAHIQSGQYAKDLEFFHSPLDQRWSAFLKQITPSFMMISTDNISVEVSGSEDINLSPQLETIVLHALSQKVPIVPLYEIKVNFSDVTAFFIDPKLMVMHNWESFCAAHWDCSSELLRLATIPSIDVSSITSAAQLWAKIIAEAKSSGSEGQSEHFDSLCCAVLLSTLICNKRGPKRTYLASRTDGKRGLDVIKDRRLLLKTAVGYLEKIDYKTAKFPLGDLWDGRMIISIFDEICANEAVMPYRVQEEFAKLHIEAKLAKSIAVDTNERLFETVDESENPLKKLPILYEIESNFLAKLIPEMKELDSQNKVKDGRKQDYADWFKDNMMWKFKEVEEEFTKPPEKIENLWQLRRANKMKQFMSRWYEMFSNSLEGRGSNLLVDFSRTPKGYMVAEAEKKDDKKGGKGGWSGQKAGGGTVKPGAKSKKDLIMEANKSAKNAKIADGEKERIKFGLKQGKNAISYLESLVSSLDLNESKALCEYEMTVKIGKILVDEMAGKDRVGERRVEAVRLVGLIKNCLTKHWTHLDDKQKSIVVDLWVSLGFEAPAGSKPSSDAKNKKLDLDINMVYYQMEHAGELIDIQSDAQKDPRVTGFAPDAWQRRMLDAVDLGNSALIIAPTSAGKTFVSYYCIEKVLRSSDEDVVVYVSPSKALTNQVCGSIYARFRNKTLLRGKSLFGALTNDYDNNALTCQVLVTVPDALENLLLSTNPMVQQFASRIKYVIFDEVHSIGASIEAPIWEHLLLFIRCPFIALSATIGNAEKLHEWLDKGEQVKSGGKRKVDLITYGERYSELEMAIQKIEKPQPIDEEGEEREKEVKKVDGDCIQQFMPYGVFTPEKMRMFGIPEDQQLTSRQVLQLYRMMSEVDDTIKKSLEPCTYFKYEPGTNVWLSRSGLRALEGELKKKLLEWLNTDEKKISNVLTKLGEPVKDQLEHRAIPFNRVEVAMNNIIPLVDELKEKAMLPAICFNDDRTVCEELARKLCEELEERQKEFEESAEFKTKFMIKDEEKMAKAAKRKRDAKEKKDKRKDKGGEKGEEGESAQREDDGAADEMDPLMMQKAKMKAALAKFKLHGRIFDDDVYEKVVERMNRASKNKESTKFLLRLFERGIGFHHAGLNTQERGAVEILFRSGHLALIFSTSTLALGMNMPCKTVIFGVDTHNLNPLLFRQMSGRAGRRGFDRSGTVVFMGIPTGKIRRLLTASLSNLQGNPPFTTSYLLRLLAYVHHDFVVQDEKGVSLNTLDKRAESAITLLSNSFSLFTRSQATDGSLQKQLRLFVAFSVQLLRHLQLIDNKGRAKGMWQLAVNIKEAPGNLLLVHLLHNGVFHSYCKKFSGEELKRKMLMLLSSLFNRLRLPPSFRPDDKGSYPSATNAAVFIDPVPKDVRKHIDEYNETVLSLFRQFTKASAPNGRLVDDRFAVSGAKDETISLFPQYLVTPLYEGHSSDISFLPTLNLDEVDHRGRKVHYNAFAYDFWVHESRSSLWTINRIPSGSMWALVSEFKNMLGHFSEAMQVVARPTDPVAELMKQLAYEYDVKFRKAFGMKLNL